METEQNIPQTGPEAIAYALEHTSREDLEKQADKLLQEGKKTGRTKAVQLLNIARGMERNNLQPKDYTISAVPVIPTKYRPFAAQGDTLIPGDANVLYKDLIDVRNAYNEERDVFGDENVGDSRLATYDAVRSVYGYGDPVKPKTKAKGVKGFLKAITGSTSKFSYVQSRLLAKTQDNVGRSTVIVNPEMDIDQIGIPKDMAFTMYAPYIQRKLKGMGLTDADALKHTSQKTDMAMKALESVVKERPVIYSRAPSWHRFSVNAGNVKLIDGDAIETNPYIAAGMGMDYDGDLVFAQVLVKYRVTNLDDENYKSDDIFLVKKHLTGVLDAATLTAMYKNALIPTYDTENEVVCLSDMEDIRHGEYSNSVDGKNGPIHFYHALPGTEVLAYNPLTGNLAWKEVKFWSEHPDREVEIVTLESGKQIFTDDDPRAVYGISEMSTSLVPERFTPDQALEKNVLVPVVREISSCEKGKEAVDTPVGTFNLDFRFGQLLGIICGDGWWDKKDYHAGAEPRYIYVADNDGYNAAYTREAIKTLFNVTKLMETATHRASTEKDRYGSTTCYTFCFAGCSEFTKSLTSWLGGERDEKTSGSANKHLPGFYLSGSREFREGLLCGLMDTDGTCSISHAKGKPQLMLAYSTTSFRLAREVKLLCMSLGVRATVGYSKRTKGGNDAWVVSISSVDAKKHNVLNRMAHVRKRDIFTQTTVSDSPAKNAGDNVPYTKGLDAIIRPHLYQPKQVVTEDDEKAKAVSRSLVAKEISKGTISRYVANRLLVWLEERYQQQLLLQEKALVYLRSAAEECDTDRLSLVREALLCTANAKVNNSSYSEMMKVYNRTKIVTKTWSMGLKLKRGIAEYIEAHKPLVGTILDDPSITTWKRVYIDQPGISWERVTNVEKTGKTETGYDLTVPGYETFMNSEGVILSNTINVHVPASDDAVKEAYNKLMPSQDPFSDRIEGKIVPLPKQEQILGLYTAATAPSTQSVVFDTEDEALHAIRSGKVPLSADVQIRKGVKMASVSMNAEMLEKIAAIERGEE